MFISSVSNRKLHCCLVILILFILIFLSLPLLLIYLANTRYEEWQNRRTQSIYYSTSSSEKNSNITSQSVPTATTTPLSPNTNQVPNLSWLQQATTPSINCTEFAIQTNLSLADENCK